jgi:hypothetical protein
MEKQTKKLWLVDLIVPATSRENLKRILGKKVFDEYICRIQETDEEVENDRQCINCGNAEQNHMGNNACPDREGYFYEDA